MHCIRRRLLRRGLEFHECTINKSAHNKKVWKLIVCSLYIYLSIHMHQSINLLPVHHTWFKSCIYLSIYLSIRVDSYALVYQSVHLSIAVNSYLSPVHTGVVAIEKEAFGSPSTTVVNFTYFLHAYIFNSLNLVSDPWVSWCLLRNNNHQAVKKTITPSCLAFYFPLFALLKLKSFGESLRTFLFRVTLIFINFSRCL